MNSETLQFTRNDLIETLRKINSELISDLKNTNVPFRKSKYCTPAELSEYFRVSPMTVSRLTKSGKLKSYRLQGKILYCWDEVDQALDEVDQALDELNEGGK